MELYEIARLNERNCFMANNAGLGKTSEQIPIEKKESFDAALTKLVSQSQDKSVDRLKGKKDITPQEMEEIFEAAARKNNVPLKLLKAMAKAESQFKPYVVSSAGAMGVMQLMPKTAKALGVVDAFDPYENIMGGAKYIGDKLKMYGGDVKLALAAYSAGSGAVKKYGGVPPFKETINHIKKVTNFMLGDLNVPDNIHKGVNTAKKSLNVLEGKQKHGKQEIRVSNELQGISDEYLKAKIALSIQQINMRPIFSDEKEQNSGVNNFDLERDSLLAMLKNL
ncbi:MAG: lytic transglycosylase domain-containing protein [Eubacteriales bacterium]